MFARCRRVFWRPIFLAILCVVFAAPFARSQDPAPTISPRDQMTLRMVQLAQAGRLQAAREVLKSYLAENPTDGTMLYNLTCLDLYLKENEQALADLEKALGNGYTNFRLIEGDRDLNPVRDDPRFIDMVARFEEEFRQKFLARALYLDEGYTTEGILLQPTPALAAMAGTSRPEVSVAFNSRDLLVSVGVDDANCEGDAPPWQGGCGVLVNLVHPISPDDYESRRYFSFAFYSSHGQPAAALVGKHGQVLLQPEPALAPAITRQGNRTVYEIAIPWEKFTPYAPPLDQELGLNIFYLSAGQSASRLVYSLMDEDRLSFEASPWRRYVPVVFQTSDRTVPVMRGRLYERLAMGDSLGVQLALWSDTEGEAECRLSFHPQIEPGLIVGAPEVDSFPCETELNFFNTYLNLQDLASGSYLLRAEVTGPDGVTFSQDFPFDNLEKDWISSLNERVYAVKTPEQSILNYHLFALARQAEIRHPQDDASDLHRARAEVVRLIELCEAGASCLPDSGLFRGGFTSDVMTMRYCAMYLPLGFKQWNHPKLVMALPPEPGSEDDLAKALGAALAGKAEAIPQSPGYSSLAVGKAAEETALALEWARRLFPGGTVTLVGMGKGTDAALETSLLRPELCQEVLLDGDQIYSDLNGFSEAAVQQALGNRRNALPYTMTSGSLASPRLPVVVAAMKQLGFQVETRASKTPAPDAAAVATWFLATH